MRRLEGKGDYSERIKEKHKVRHKKKKITKKL